MTKTKRKKKKTKRNAFDLTGRNAKSYNRRFNLIEVELGQLTIAHFKRARYCNALVDILKSKRLLTPAQVKMLEDCLR